MCDQTLKSSVQYYKNKINNKIYFLSVSFVYILNLINMPSFENVDIIKHFYLCYLKFILNLKSSLTSFHTYFDKYYEYLASCAFI